MSQLSQQMLLWFDFKINLMLHFAQWEFALQVLQVHCKALFLQCFLKTSGDKDVQIWWYHVSQRSQAMQFLFLIKSSKQTGQFDMANWKDSNQGASIYIANIVYIRLC